MEVQQLRMKTITFAVQSGGSKRDVVLGIPLKEELVSRPGSSSPVSGKKPANNLVSVYPEMKLPLSAIPDELVRLQAEHGINARLPSEELARSALTRAFANEDIEDINPLGTRPAGFKGYIRSKEPLLSSFFVPTLNSGVSEVATDSPNFICSLDLLGKNQVVGGSKDPSTIVALVVELDSVDLKKVICV